MSGTFCPAWDEQHRGCTLIAGHPGPHGNAEHAQFTTTATPAGVEPITPIHAWVPDLDAARYALAGRGLIDPKPEFREMHLNDVRAVLDASGANAEIEGLRAVLHAAHHVIATLRAENTDLLNLALEATRAAATEPVDLAAGILRRIAEPAGEHGPDVLAEAVADMGRAESSTAIRQIVNGPDGFRAAR